MNQDLKIACPKCEWEPDGQPYWMCTHCQHTWDTFETAAVCPSCANPHEYTSCIPHAGGCHTSSRHEDWYRGLDEWLRLQLEALKVQVREQVLQD